MNLMILRKMLKRIPIVLKMGITIVEKVNGREAVTYYENNFINMMTDDNRVKIIFMDCEMPVLDGYQASQEIREIESKRNIAQYIQQDNVNKLDKVKIIGVSGNEGESHEKKCKNMGMNYVLKKPVMYENLERIV